MTSNHHLIYAHTYVLGYDWCFNSLTGVSSGPLGDDAPGRHFNMSDAVIGTLILTTPNNLFSFQRLFLVRHRINETYGGSCYQLTTLAAFLGNIVNHRIAIM